jgi:hypothetical protein
MVINVVTMRSLNLYDSLSAEARTFRDKINFIPGHDISNVENIFNAHLFGELKIEVPLIIKLIYRK